MESGDCTTCYSCKQYREHELDTVSVVYCKACYCRERAVKGRMSNDNTKSCYCKHSVQQKRTQVITRLKQNPYRCYRGDCNVKTYNPHPGLGRQIQRMEIHTNCHNNNDCKYTYYRCNAHRHIPAIYAETKYDSNENEQNGNHCYSSRSSRFSHIKSSTLIINSTKSRCYDRSKGCYYQDQRQIREDDKQLFCTFAHISGNDLSDGLSFIADRCEQCTKVMHAAEEDTSDKDPQSYRKPSEHSCSDRSGNRACTCDG